MCGGGSHRGEVNEERTSPQLRRLRRRVARSRSERSQDSSNAILALFADVPTGDVGTLVPDPQAFLTDGLEVGVIDRPGEKQIPGVMSARLRIQKLREGRFDILGGKPCVRLSRLAVCPDEEPDETCCGGEDRHPQAHYTPLVQLNDPFRARAPRQR